MTTIVELRDRSTALFTELLGAMTRAPRSSRGPAAAREAASFSWFDPADAIASAALSFRLAALASSRARVNDALTAALDHVDELRAGAHPELVRQGLAIFVTHNVVGRRLAKPRTVTAAPGLFRPPGTRRGGAAPVSIGGLSPGLDYWREDALANEHHEHWHQVYPYTGLPPRDFGVWAAQTPRPGMIAILEALAPGQDWEAQVNAASVTQLARLFAQVAGAQQVTGLPRDLYRLMFGLNDRQGELFFYMHQQMLARYDAELASNGLPRVGPFGPGQWNRTIDEGHDPVGLARFSRRDQGRRLTADDVASLRELQQEIDDALADGKLHGTQGTVQAIGPSTLGEAVEATIPQLRDLDPARYFGLHNSGHGAIASLSVGSQSVPPRLGVMISTVTAIRDQIFWRWHKHVDELNFRWQQTRPTHQLESDVGVVLRDGLGGRAPTAWASPDVILCRTVDIPAGDPAALGQQAFGGDNWTTDFSANTAGALRTVGELTTTMASVPFGGRTIRFLTHEPFTYFLRVENPGAAERAVTVRIFLGPAAAAADRRAWIEMDKFPLTVPAQTKLVVHRADTESSVVKRPVDRDPAAVLGGGSGPTENTYCDCGWPYTLLLPRGTASGLSCRLAVICTNAANDQVPEQGQCGSMSYCGAVDRYPDARDMGYPFAQRFAGPAARAVRDAIMTAPGAAARTVTIRHG